MGEPGAKLRRVFSHSVTGESAALLGGMPRTDISNGGMVMGPSEKCGSVLGPANSNTGLCTLPGCEFDALIG